MCLFIHSFNKYVLCTYYVGEADYVTENQFANHKYRKRARQPVINVQSIESVHHGVSDTALCQGPPGLSSLGHRTGIGTT